MKPPAILVTVYYVVTWDFELEESGETVKDGVVFTDLKSAQEEARDALIASIDSDFAARLPPVLSKRLGKAGYITGESCIQEVEALHPENALQKALEGRGKEVT